jgi:hypothetical protein
MSFVMKDGIVYVQDGHPVLAAFADPAPAAPAR